MPNTPSRPTIFYGWFIVTTTFLMALVTAGSRNAFGVFVIPMSKEFGWNRSTISLVAASLDGLTPTRWSAPWV